MSFDYRAIDDLLTFSVDTHALAGGDVDADALPIYRLYEDTTDTPILTGTLAKFDDANTLGFYRGQVALSEANGFEPGKSYTLRLSATVGGITESRSEYFSIWPEVIPSTIGIDGVPVVYVEGPFVLEVVGSGAGGMIRRSAGDPLSVAVILKAGRRPVNLAGKTPTAQLLDSAGDSAAAVTPTVAFESGGQITLAGTVPAEIGIYRLTARPSSTDWTYGPLLVEVV